MKENFHTHLPYCGHASGRAIDYVVKAKELGFSALGFSDHTPVSPNISEIGGFQMQESELTAYQQEVLEAKRTSGDLKLFLGLEADIISTEFSYLKDLIIPKISPDYVIGSVHYLRFKDGLHRGMDKISSASEFDLYIEQLLWAIEQPEFIFIGHPDRVIISAYGMKHDKELKSSWRAVAIAAAKWHKPLEFNTSKQAGRAPCVSETFWHEVIEASAPIVVASDAHHPDRLNLGLQEAYHWLEERDAKTIFTSDLLIRS